MDKIQSKERAKKIIKDILLTHSTKVEMDDPIMILYTLNEQLGQLLAEDCQQIVEDFKSQMEELMSRWNETAKQKAEQTLNVAMRVSRETINNSMQEAAKKAEMTIESKVNEFSSKMATPLQEIKHLTIINMIVASMSFIAALGAFLTWLTQ